MATTLWAYAAALERSRTDDVGVANLYLLTGTTAAPPVSATRCGAAWARRSSSRIAGATIGVVGLDEGRLNALAFGVLVPMFGIGANGLWAARHGRYEPRRRGATAAPEQPQDRLEIWPWLSRHTDTITIAAPPEQVWAIAADVERYPDWAKDVKDVVVRSRDEEGRPAEVEFRASALGRSTHYTLGYDYSHAPNVLAWKMVHGDIMRTIDGAYTVSPTNDGGTEVRYDLIIELVVPLPGFVKRRAEVRILNTVRELKIRAESPE